MTDAEYQQLTRRLSAYGLSLCERIDVIHSAAMAMAIIGMQNPAARVAANRTLAYLEREAERMRQQNAPTLPGLE